MGDLPPIDKGLMNRIAARLADVPISDFAKMDEASKRELRNKAKSLLKTERNYLSAQARKSAP